MNSRETESTNTTIEKPSFSTKRIRVWQLLLFASLLCAIMLIFTSLFFISDTFYTGFIRPIPRRIVLATSFVFAFIVILVMYSLFPKLAIPTLIVFYEDHADIVYGKKSIYLKLTDINKILINNRGDYSKVIFYLSNKHKLKYHFGIANFRIANLFKRDAKVFVLIDDISKLEHLLIDFQMSSECNLDLKVERYIFTSKHTTT